MQKILVRNCRYASSPLTGEPCFTDLYVLVDDDGQMLWHENLFLSEMALSYSLNTIRSIANDLLSFSKMAYPIGGWKQITKSHMLGYLHAELFQRRDYSKATLMRHIDTLKKFYHWLERKGYLDVIPDFMWRYNHLYIKKPPDKTSYLASHHPFHSLYIDKDAFYQLLAAVPSKNPFIKARDRITLRLGYDCGVRASEVLNIDLVTVKKSILHSKENNGGLWATSRIEIIGKGDSKRELLLPPDLCEQVMEYINKFRMKLNNDTGSLICSTTGDQIKDQKYASTVFSKAFKTADLTRTNRQGYHRLRKSYGTNLVQDCYDNNTDPWVEVPRRLGHRDFHTTLRYIQFDALRNNRSRVLSELAMTSDKYKAIQISYIKTHGI